MQIRPGELRAGDILLLRSTGLLAWAIRFFDGAEVDRAALYLGEGRVLECVDGAAVARRLGRGVHPESLLGWAAQPIMRSRLMGAAAPEPLADLEGALSRYQGEAREGTQSAPPTRAEGDALLGSLQRFAAAWSG